MEILKNGNVQIYKMKNFVVAECYSKKMKHHNEVYQFVDELIDKGYSIIDTARNAGGQGYGSEQILWFCLKKPDSE